MLQPGCKQPGGWQMRWAGAFKDPPALPHPQLSAAPRLWLWHSYRLLWWSTRNTKCAGVKIINKHHNKTVILRAPETLLRSGWKVVGHALSGVSVTVRRHVTSCALNEHQQVGYACPSVDFMLLFCHRWFQTIFLRGEKKTKINY